LRQLAVRCLSHSRDCFDLKGVERFRVLADDLLAKAAELEGKAASRPPLRRRSMQQQPVQQQQMVLDQDGRK